MRIARTGSGPRRSGAAALVGAVALAPLLVAGCAGDRKGGAVADSSVSSVESGVGASSTTVSVTTRDGTETKGPGGTSPPTSGPRSTTSRQGGGGPSTTSRRTNPPSTRRSTTTTTKPKVKPKLTVTIKETGTAEGSVDVSPGGACSSSCSYSFAKGTSVTLDPNPIEAHLDWVFSGPGGGQASCNEGNPCTFTINDSMSVTVVFGSPPEGTMRRPISS
jgi:hypothetical protein